MAAISLLYLIALALRRAMALRASLTPLLLVVSASQPIGRLIEGGDSMATMQTNYHDTETLVVVHPLDDEPEMKRSTEGLAPLEMTRSVKVSLMVLRAYLTTMTLMLIYHVLDLAGSFGK